MPETVDETISLKTSTFDHSNLVTSISHKVGTWTKLVNVVSNMLKFVDNLKKRIKPRGDTQSPLSSFGFRNTEQFIFSRLQQEAFPLASLGKGVEGVLSSLDPFLDENLLRVGGRLKRTELSRNIKHPVLLPDKHPATELLVRHIHESVKHQGRLITLGKVREEGIFVLHGTRVVKSVISKCVTCRKLRGSTLTQKMADLPIDRLYECPPFTFTGLDVFGPFYVSEGQRTRRNTPERKRWAVVFICLVTKAIHIEILEKMDTSSFKLALARFFSIRGQCTRLRSDRGSNFIGAHNQEKFDLQSLQGDAAKNGCEWTFNPPHSSHFGGIWERSIHSIRKIIDASLLTLGKRKPTSEELYTFMCEASSIVNNTPLYEVSSDPNDSLPISPAHLLTLKDAPNPPPLENFSEQDLLAYGSRRWRRVQDLSEVFWQKWRRDYLQNLQHRQKWQSSKINVKVGDIVLLKQSNTRRNAWLMAKVTAVKTSLDGLVRSVVLDVPSEGGKSLKSFVRPIKEMVPILHCYEA